MAKHSTSQPASSSTGGPKHSKPGQAKRDRAQIHTATATAASVSPSRTGRQGKPSVVGHAAGGLAKGAALGATVGTVVPGIGTVVGAGVGAAVGGTAGTVGGVRAKGAYRRAQRTSGQRLLVVEFVIAVVILGFSPLTDKHKTDSPGAWMKRATGVCALWLVLGLVGAAGPRAAKAAAAFGGLVLVALAVSDRSIFTAIAARFGAPPSVGPAGPTGGDIIGGAIGGIDIGGGAGAIGGAVPGAGIPDGGRTPTLPGTPVQPGRQRPPGFVKFE